MFQLRFGSVLWETLKRHRLWLVMLLVISGCKDTHYIEINTSEPAPTPAPIESPQVPNQIQLSLTSDQTHIIDLNRYLSLDNQAWSVTSVDNLNQPHSVSILAAQHLKIVTAAQNGLQTTPIIVQSQSDPMLSIQLLLSINQLSTSTSQTKLLFDQQLQPNETWQFNWQQAILGRLSNQQPIELLWLSTNASIQDQYIEYQAPSTPGVAQIQFSFRQGELYGQGTIDIVIGVDQAILTAANWQGVSPPNQSLVIDLDALMLLSGTEANNAEIIQLSGQVEVFSQIAPKQILVTPDDSQGPWSINYKVSTPNGVMSLAQIQVSLSDAQGPTAQAITASVLMEQALTLDISPYINHPLGDNLQLVKTLGGQGQVAITADTKLTYTPPIGFTGTDEFVYIIEDSRKQQIQNIVNINVIDPYAANQPPQVSPIVAATQHDIPLALDISPLVSDPENDPLSISAIYGAAGLVTVDGLVLNYDPSGFVGTDHFTLAISDGRLVRLAEAVISVSDPNSPPISIDDNITMTHGDVLTLDVSYLVQDQDDDPITLTHAIAHRGQISMPTAMSIRYTAPTAGDIDTLSLIFSDGKGGFSLSQLKVTLQRVANTPPTLSLITATTDSQTDITIDIGPLINDADNDVVSVVAVYGAQGNVIFANQILNYQPQGFIGEDVFDVVISDGVNTVIGSALVSVSDASPNQSPNANTLNITALEANRYTPLTINISSAISDADGDALTISQVYPPSQGSATATGEQIISYQMNTLAAGQDQIAYTISDGQGGLATGLINIQLPELPRAEITSLTINGTLLPGYTISAEISCDHCEASYHSYRWLIDEQVVSTAANYTLSQQDKFKHVRLEAQTSNSLSLASTTEYVTYARHQVKTIYANYFAFAALMTDDTVVTWGQPDNGGNISAVADQLVDVATIFAGSSTFAALKHDGSVVTWGKAEFGGDSSTVQADLQNVSAIYANNYAMAAVKNDGSVVTWGTSDRGGDSSSVAGQLVNVSTIAHTESAFAALKQDGSVVTWGRSNNGGDMGGLVLSNIQQIKGSAYAFSALDHSGAIYQWGLGRPGTQPGGALTYADSNVTQVVSNKLAFAYIRADAIGLGWGDKTAGGDMENTLDTMTNVASITASETSFAFLDYDGAVKAIGTLDSIVYGSTEGISGFFIPTTVDVQSISSTYKAFAALEADGTVVTWGDGIDGGDSTAVASQLTQVKQIYGNRYAFAALKHDGSIVAWGRSTDGGDASAVADRLTNIQTIYHSDRGFSAIDNQGNIISWGNAGHANSDNVSALLPHNKLLQSSID
ncbi:Ig-like domain-containing protein [Shewanella sp. NIFS-20-20]|uniref:Ig-like domain-containing protein n=1 Tax=Shewanella sp. NIFS-20-20 TaxID=2853806 RepID=UPI001C46BC8B|nr:Ig-like domain-containing protein [Shewanella sp. NIFS-20-20]MBV7314122.1 tandem-95 repeat protein [Shewanella sp. NIFS-20-20]